MKKGTTLLFGVAGMTLITGLLLSGCAHTQSDEGTIKQIEDKDARQQIEKGKTTRNEILKWFGAPDKTIDAGVSPQTKAVTADDVNTAQKHEVTIGKNQEVYVYEHSETRTEGGFPVPFRGKRKISSIRKNALMIWIDKDSGIVQDYSYRKEI